VRKPARALDASYRARHVRHVQIPYLGLRTDLTEQRLAAREELALRVKTGGRDLAELLQERSQNLARLLD
jgi:hypothetical protein